MKMTAVFWRFALLSTLIFLGCKSEFERVRTSGNTDLIFEKAMEYYDAEKYQRAQVLMELIINSYRGQEEFEELNFKFAYTYYYLRQYITAAYYFDTFFNAFPNSPRREEAAFMRAYANYQLSPNPRLDQEYTRKAIDGFQTFINTFPNSDRVVLCNDLMDELRSKLEQKAFLEALLYFDLQNYQSAIHAFENLLRDFPDTDNAVEVRYYIIRSYYLFAENSIYTRQRERYETAEGLAAEFLSRYGNNGYRDEVRDMLNDSREKLKELSNE
jgi:outer membrane protein assembly factor BamD